MAEPVKHKERGIYTYKIRIMSSIVVAELLCLALVIFWPLPDQEKVYQDITENTEEVVVQAPVQTRQQSKPPPPPAPPVPVPVPNDQVIEEQELEFTDDIFSNSFDSLSTTAGQGGLEGEDRIVENPAIGPRVIRIVEPPIKQEGKDRYEIAVEFLVDKEGNVEEAVIVGIYRLDEEGNRKEKVLQISDNITTEVIKAAMDWKFRPAQQNGKPVRSYTKNYFTI